MKRQRGLNKEPSLFRQIVMVYYEQAKQRRAMRILSKQTWSIEFLTSIINRCKDDYVLELHSPDGATILLKKNTTFTNTEEDDILNHLDDDTIVNRFIARNGRS